MAGDAYILSNNNTQGHYGFREILKGGWKLREVLDTGPVTYLIATREWNPERRRTKMYAVSGRGISVSSIANEKLAFLVYTLVRNRLLIFDTLKICMIIYMR